MERKRNIDIAKGLVILSVVLGHLVLYDSLGYKIIFSFHMPFFFIMTGYCLRESTINVCFSKYLFKNIKGILVPAILIRLLWLLALHHDQIFTLDIKFIVERMTNSHFEWFLSALFFAKILFWFYYRINNHSLVFYILSLGIIYFIGEQICSRGYHYVPSNCFIPIDCSLIALTFIIIGFYLKENFNSMNEKALCRKLIFMVFACYSF